MNKLKLLVFTVVFITSCVDNDPNEEIIHCPIPEKDFQDIIKTTFLINAHIHNQKMNNKFNDTIKENTLNILEEKGYDKKDLFEAIKFYSSKPNILDSLISDIKDSLEKQQNIISDDDD